MEAAAGLGCRVEGRGSGRGQSLGAGVGLAVRPARVHVRDSKDTTCAALTVEPTAWTAFVEFAAL
ncbi:DUF397 domain-containing protein [Streptomyces capitiformicae]|uniref:DUF397 domain-containing protein n=1 Tax=Streptomyces capitiformicae TaxID=2014920 RepID=A0A918YYD3_9ACTN|nr:hypothetical protein GCM10017771_44470 [Streptomyces capitiformicae]